MKKLLLIALAFLTFTLVACDREPKVVSVTEYEVLVITSDSVILERPGAIFNLNNTKIEVARPVWFDKEVGDRVYVRLYDNDRYEIIKED